MAISKWTGELDLTVFNNGRKVVARDIYFQGALKVMRPIYLNGSIYPTFYIVNVGGGYLDKDRYRVNVNVKDNARVTLTSQGATKIYKTLEDRVEQYQTFNVGEDAYLEYVGDPIIAYKNAKFYQENCFKLTDKSALYYTDIVTPGWSEEDKTFTYTYMHLKNEVYINDEIVVYDNLKLVPGEKGINDMGYMEGYTHYGTALFIHPDIDKQIIPKLRKITEKYKDVCRVGITMLPTHGISIRVFANMTEEIEAVFLDIQNDIAQKYYNRKVEFLRKY